MTSTMRAWQYSNIEKTIEESMTLNQSALAPSPSSLGKDQLLFEVISASINPVDFKFPESGGFAKTFVKRPAVPGHDFCGRVTATHPSNKSFQKGQLVFGAVAWNAQLGSLGQFLIASNNECALLPDGVSPDQAATLGTAGLTAFQSLIPSIVKPGSKVFINGGSGGVGTFSIQFAKAMGAQVTTSCSATNVQLCKSLGADEVIDYKATEIIPYLEAKGQSYDFVIDNIGFPTNLYQQCPRFLKAEGAFAQVGMGAGMGSVLRASLLPGFLGGGKRKFHFIRMQSKTEDYAQIAKLLAEGKAKAVINESFSMEDAPKAFAKLRTGRVAGKLVIHVSRK